MDEATLLGLERSVPRYTSYPTAAQFGAGVDAASHRAWLNALPDGDVALYAHVPYCRALCWYCACHTAVTRGPEQMDAYGVLLADELKLVARDVGAGRRLAALQLGGGTPTELGSDGLERLADRIAAHFAIDRTTEISIETDPRYLTPARAAVLGAIGVNRASLGVQDFSPAVQRAINRWQPVETTARAMDALRRAGIERINIDLVYGLPLQTPDMLAATLAQTVALGPSRIAVFGYAHVPWMARRQRAIDDAMLPDMATRQTMARLTARELVAAGYVAIGIDHYARPDDPLALAACEGRLRRNFQGYTDVPAVPQIGLGASAISQLPQGFSQNAVGVKQYAECLHRGTYATARGRAISDDDRLAADVIERLMCDFAVDLDAVARRHRVPAAVFNDDLERLRPYVEQRVVAIDGARVRITAEGRIATRLICAAFDHYLPTSGARHSKAV
ncbi:MAG: oxygen-independent coproporphyrinogen III oxidase [Alphaproteobacteria bacterium]|nr:oxygen-independent coproporphyrinogen III oxidase [Alphaproteobacteria bacterium]MCW5742463.1 oxygen-independent coproporphyrinogen III oxidase [Alphaproteobacteria bacterium]